MRGRVVITGGAGFIGSHLCDQLIQRSCQVICVDNFSSGRMSNIEQLISHPRFSLIRADVVDQFDIEEEVDLVFHLASPSSPRDYLRMPIETLRVGSLGTLNTLELARRKNARFVFASSSEIYGQPQVNPQPESYPGSVSPTGPRAAYAEAKRFGEACSMAYSRTYGTSVGIVRIFNAFGQRMRCDDGRVVPTFITQSISGQPITVVGSGSQTRSFIYVSDLVEGMLRMALSSHVGPINIGGEEEVAIDFLARMIVKLTSTDSPLVGIPERLDEPRVRRPDTKLARELLDWKPVVGLEDGLVRTVSWFRNQLEQVGR